MIKFDAEQFEFEYTVQEKDLDIFGHVNNANYLNFYEMARWDFITKRGYGLDHIQRTKKGPVLLNVDLQFRKELKNRDRIIITSKAQKIEGKFLYLYQEMIRDGKLCSKATFMITFFDLEKRKMLEANSDWLKACGVKILES